MQFDKVWRSVRRCEWLGLGRGREPLELRLNMDYAYDYCDLYCHSEPDVLSMS